jgi:hypothetical protein
MAKVSWLGTLRALPARIRVLRRDYPTLTTRRLLNYLLVHLEMRLGRTQLWSRPYEI